MSGLLKRFVSIFFFFLMTAVSSAQVAPVDGWEKRMNRGQPPVKIMDAIGLKEGMTIGDIGAGRGRLAIWFAQRVGSRGRVYANDIDRESLDYLEARIRPRSVRNIVTVLGEVEDPCIPEDTLDLAFMINTYHHIADPVILLRNLIPSLKREGRIAIVEADPEKLDHTSWHATDRKKLLGHLAQAGYVLERIETSLKEDNIYIFKVKPNDG